MSNPFSRLDVLHEDDHLLAVVKPAGIPTAHAPAGSASLYTLAREARPFVGVVSRLDVPVSGVVLFAKTPAAAAELSRQFREREVTKEYAAVVEGRFPAPLEQWVDFVDRDPGEPPVRGARERGASRGEGRESRTRARVVRRAGEVSLVELEPATGRKHQLRIQLASRRCPIVGDRRYGARLPFPEGIALHARRLTVGHPATGAPLTIESPVPRSWTTRFATLFAGR